MTSKKCRLLRNVKHVKVICQFMKRKRLYMSTGIKWGIIKMFGLTMGYSYGYNPYSYSYGYGNCGSSNWATFGLGVLSGLTVGALAGRGFGCGGYYGYNPFYGPSVGMIADSIVTPGNAYQSLYMDLDSPMGVSSVSPLVNYAIRNPMFGAYTGLGVLC